MVAARTPASRPRQKASTHGAQRAGLYGPDSEAWRLNREALMLLGSGPRALLLQIAHPLVAEGVDQHSDFRSDPWTRLAETTRSYLRIVYGTGTAARAEIRRLNAMHRTIVGPVLDTAARGRLGDRYAARDPALSLWVHATLVDSTIVAYDAWIEPLSRERRARYYEETRQIARAFGVPDDLLPADLDAFEAYVAGMLAFDGPVHPTATARELARTILHPPLRPLAARGPVARRLGRLRAPVAVLAGTLPSWTYDWTLAPALALLPPSTRTEYGLHSSTVDRALAAWLVAGWRGWRGVLPKDVREFPLARAADRRLLRSEAD